jgi:small subunit ribosomal protein S6
MALYEHVFIARQDVSAQQVEALTEEFKTVLESNGGSVAKNEYWGIKTLAYKIRKNRKGHYTLLNIDAPHAAVAEMERQMRLHDDILRFITLRVDEHEEGPSAMMQSRGRDDRRGGRGGDRGGDRGGRGGDRGSDRGADRGERRPAPAAEAAESATDAPASEGADA